MESLQINKNPKLLERNCETENFYSAEKEIRNVRRLYITNIPGNITEEDFKNYFSNFGAVVSMEFKQNKKSIKNKTKYKFGFVNYKESKCALKALKSVSQFLCTEDQKFLQLSQKQQISIGQIDDNCLQKIFSFIPLKEQLKLSLLCDRFRNIFEKNFQEEEFIDIHLNSDETMYKDNLFECISKLRGNDLETFLLISSSPNDLQQDYICSMKGLKNLVILGDITRGEYYDDDNGSLLNEIDEKFLEKITYMPNLINLNIPRCNTFNREWIARLLARSKYLESLDISDCKQIDLEAIYYVMDEVKNLKRSKCCKLFIGGTSIDEDILSDPKYLDCTSFLQFSFHMSELTARYSQEY